MPYTASISNGQTHITVRFEETSDDLGDLLCTGFFAATEDDLRAFGDNDPIWVDEIRDASTGHLVYFCAPDVSPETHDLACTPVPGSECVMA